MDQPPSPPRPQKTIVSIALAVAAGLLALQWFAWRDTSNRLAEISTAVARLAEGYPPPAPPPNEITQTASPTINVGESDAQRALADAKARGWATPSEYARIKGKDRDWVYQHAEELGGTKPDGVHWQIPLD